jgi:hypothetical protein
VVKVLSILLIGAGLALFAGNLSGHWPTVPGLGIIICVIGAGLYIRQASFGQIPHDWNQGD